MTRDEAVAALEALPETTRLSVAKIEPTDVIVVEVDEIIDEATSAYIRERLRKAFPTNEVVVLGEGVRLKIGRPA